MINADIDKKTELSGDSRETDNFIVTYSLYYHIKTQICKIHYVYFCSS